MHDCFVIYSYVVHVEPFGNELLSLSNRKVQRFEVDLKSSLFWHFVFYKLASSNILLYLTKIMRSKVKFK